MSSQKCIVTCEYDNITALTVFLVGKLLQMSSKNYINLRKYNNLQLQMTFYSSKVNLPYIGLESKDFLPVFRILTFEKY